MCATCSHARYPHKVSTTLATPNTNNAPTPAYRTTCGETRSAIHCLNPAPIEAAKAPFVAIAATAAIHTTYGDPNLADIVAAVICPTSPHSEKKIATNDNIAALPARLSFSYDSRSSGFRHNVIASPTKLKVVTPATNGGGSF